MKLLIVDDHAGMRAMIRQLAALPDGAVRECDSGEAAIRLAREFAPDVVTMDVRLPGLSGLEAARTIRCDRPATQVVVVSAYDLPSLRVAARHVGAADFVLKDRLELLQQVLARFDAPAHATQPPLSSSAAGTEG
jgi:two-component system, NarL family, invasion response regulator UvrY